MTRQILIRMSHCNRCKCVFEWLPKQLNSTKGEDIYPRCPDCKSCRETCDDGVITRRNSTKPGVMYR